jgi:transposase InsO family protein
MVVVAKRPLAARRLGMHRNARLTVWGRQQIPLRRREGWTLGDIAAELNVSRATVSKWWHRFLADPDGDWFLDRSSRPHRCPHQTPPQVEAAIVALRRTERLGPARIGFRLDLPASTVWKVLHRHRLNRLAWMDRRTGRVVRRYEKDQPGDLVHVDTKRITSIPEGGGWWVWGRPHGNQYRSRKAANGYQHVHLAVDDHSRVAYGEILNDAKQATCAAFWNRAQDWFAAHGIEVKAIMTDNAGAYRSRYFAEGLGAIEHVFIRPYRPQTNGKVERLNRTLKDEWLYARPYTSNTDRAQALADWLHTYNHHRGHTAIGGPPITRVNNQLDQYS